MSTLATNPIRSKSFKVYTTLNGRGKSIGMYPSIASASSAARRWMRSNVLGTSNGSDVRIYPRGSLRTEKAWFFDDGHWHQDARFERRNIAWALNPVSGVEGALVAIAGAALLAGIVYLVTRSSSASAATTTPGSTPAPAPSGTVVTPTPVGTVTPVVLTAGTRYEVDLTSSLPLPAGTADQINQAAINQQFSPGTIGFVSATQSGNAIAVIVDALQNWTSPAGYGVGTYTMDGVTFAVTYRAVGPTPAGMQY
jgi:hypothetical protein